MPDDRPLPIPDATVARASEVDAPELLVLQRCCWVAEAILNDTLDIPALHEDLGTVRAGIVGTSVWIVRDGPRLVGAVRGHRDGDRWEIGRLMVAPDLQGRGLGRWLLRHVEDRAPASVHEYALFTGARSRRNRAMYEAAGYRLHDAPERHIPGTVFLTKVRAPR